MTSRRRLLGLHSELSDQAGDPQDSKTSRGSARFPDPNHEFVEINVTYADGKICFDMD